MDFPPQVQHRFASKKKNKKAKKAKKANGKETQGVSLIYILPITCFNYKYIKYTAPNLSFKKQMLFCFFALKNQFLLLQEFKRPQSKMATHVPLYSFFVCDICRVQILFVILHAKHN